MKLTHEPEYSPLFISKGVNRAENVVQRFISVDPLKDEYPYYTSYQYAGNKPINNIDVDGLEPDPETDTGGQKKSEPVETPQFDSGNEAFDKVANQTIGEFGIENVSINVTNIDGDISGQITVGDKTAFYNSEEGFFALDEEGNKIALETNENGSLVPFGAGAGIGTGQLLYGFGEDLTLRQNLYIEPYRIDLETHRQNPTQQNKARAAYNRQNNLGIVREKSSPLGKALAENKKSSQKSLEITEKIARGEKELGKSTNRGVDKLAKFRRAFKTAGVLGYFVDAYFALERIRKSGYDPNVIASEASGYAGAVMGGLMGAKLGLMAAPFLGPFAPLGPIIGGIAGAALGYYLTSGEATRDIQNIISPGGNDPTLFKF
ncbi:MAG: hypothetical protein JXR03_21490 [Cyclobacteriaceae bacterium]